MPETNGDCRCVFNVYEKSEMQKVVKNKRVFQIPAELEVCRGESGKELPIISSGN